MQTNTTTAHIYWSSWFLVKVSLKEIARKHVNVSWWQTADRSIATLVFKNMKKILTVGYLVSLDIHLYFKNGKEGIYMWTLCILLEFMQGWFLYYIVTKNWIIKSEQCDMFCKSYGNIFFTKLKSYVPDWWTIGLETFTSPF